MRGAATPAFPSGTDCSLLTEGASETAGASALGAEDAGAGTELCIGAGTCVYVGTLLDGCAAVAGGRLTCADIAGFIMAVVGGADDAGSELLRTT